MQNMLRMKFFLALMLMAVVPSMNAQVAHVGDILCTSGVFVSPSEYENSGLEAMGVIFYVDATGQHGWAVALEDAGNFSWENRPGGTTCLNTPLPDFETVRSAVYDLDGLFNTQEVLNYGATMGRSYPIFEALDVADGWYVPTIGQLNYLYGNIVEVNEGLSVSEGITFNMTGSWEYWSSTERSRDLAWFLNSSGGISSGSYSSNKEQQYSLRGIRNF